MTVTELVGAFDRQWSSRNFNEVQHKLSPSREVCALLILQRFMPAGQSYIFSTERNYEGETELCLNLDFEKMAEQITEDEIEFLRICGVSTASNWTGRHSNGSIPSDPLLKLSHGY
jgi:hypothetical protein